MTTDYMIKSGDTVISISNSNNIYIGNIINNENNRKVDISLTRSESKTKTIFSTGSTSIQLNKIINSTKTSNVYIDKEEYPGQLTKVTVNGTVLSASEYSYDNRTGRIVINNITINPSEVIVYYNRTLGFNVMTDYLTYCLNYNRPLNEIVGQTIKLVDNKIVNLNKYEGAVTYSTTYNKDMVSVTDSYRIDSGLMTRLTRGWSCVFTRYIGNEVQDTSILPAIPEEFSETNTSSFSEDSPLGRSVAYQTYNTSSRNVTFSLKLHRELCADQSPNGYIDSIDRLVALLKSCCYPKYDTSGVIKPPEVSFTIGDQFYIKGIMTSVGESWSGPIIDNKYNVCDLSIAITETKGPYSSDQIVAMKGYRNQGVDFVVTNSDDLDNEK